MKMYILDENGQVVFEYADKNGGYIVSTSLETQSKIITLVTNVLRFLLGAKV